jgi:hypothetical protein
MSTPLLKSKNICLLTTFIVFDALLFMYLCLDINILDIGKLVDKWENRALFLCLGTLSILFLNSLLSPNFKAKIVFLKCKNPLPGCQAFTRHIFNDPRIDIDTLRNKVGEFPTEPKKQNALWYVIYREFSKDNPIKSKNQFFLLFRDMCGILFLIIIGAVPLLIIECLFYGELSIKCFDYFLVICLIEFFICNVCARNSGISFVKDVLALKSSEK